MVLWQLLPKLIYFFHWPSEGYLMAGTIIFQRYIRQKPALHVVLTSAGVLCRLYFSIQGRAWIWNFCLLTLCWAERGRSLGLWWLSTQISTSILTGPMCLNYAGSHWCSETGQIETILLSWSWKSWGIGYAICLFTSPERRMELSFLLIE